MNFKNSDNNAEESKHLMDGALEQETQNAQKQWEQHGTVTDRYLRQALGDISKGISILPPESEKKDIKKK